MIFKDRADAGKRLAQAILHNKRAAINNNNYLVLSLVRGGVVVGYEIACELNLSHYPLIVKKIGAPHNEELAIGAICDGTYYLDSDLIDKLHLKKSEIDKQISYARQKQKEYQNRFKKNQPLFKGKIVFLVDDGIATGSSVKAALQYLRRKGAKKIILAAPVAPNDFDEADFDEGFILYKSPLFNAVSQFYENFPQVTDDQVKYYLNPSQLDESVKK